MLLNTRRFEPDCSNLRWQGKTSNSLDLALLDDDVLTVSLVKTVINSGK